MTNKIIDPERASIGKVLKDLAVNFCIMFTLFTLFSCVFGLVFADEVAKPGIIMCLSIGAAMLVCAALQAVFFTPVLIRRMGYGPRLVLFGICLYALLAVYGAVFDWFPADNVWAWVGFTITYLVILALMTVLFTAINRRDIKALNDGLARFKERESEQE